MERVRQLAGLAALAGVVPAAGCVATAHQVTASLKRAAHLDRPPVPASQVMCFWQRRLAALPDPTRDGVRRQGIVGQMFLVSPDSRPADLSGDLVVRADDATPRPPGAASQPAEVWHYTADTLRRLVTADERFGRSYALFLPWPDGWRDVTAVRLTATYKAPGLPDLDASEVRVALDFSAGGGPVWSDAGAGRPAAAGGDPRGVPDPAKLIQGMKAAGGPPAGQPLQAPRPVVPAEPAAPTAPGVVQPLILPGRAGG